MLKVVFAFLMFGAGAFAFEPHAAYREYGFEMRRFHRDIGLPSTYEMVETSFKELSLEMSAPALWTTAYDFFNAYKTFLIGVQMGLIDPQSTSFNEKERALFAGMKNDMDIILRTLGSSPARVNNFLAWLLNSPYLHYDNSKVVTFLRDQTVAPPSAKEIACKFLNECKFFARTIWNGFMRPELGLMALLAVILESVDSPFPNAGKIAIALGSAEVLLSVINDYLQHHKIRAELTQDSLGSFKKDLQRTELAMIQAQRKCLLLFL